MLVKPSQSRSPSPETPYAYVPGSPLPQGVHLAKDGVNFSLFSRHAARVWLLLFDHVDATTPVQTIELDSGSMARFNRSAGIASMPAIS